MANLRIAVLRSSVPPHGDSDPSRFVAGIGHLVDELTVNVGGQRAVPGRDDEVVLTSFLQSVVDDTELGDTVNARLAQRDVYRLPCIIEFDEVEPLSVVSHAERELHARALFQRDKERIFVVLPVGIALEHMGLAFAIQLPHNGVTRRATTLRMTWSPASLRGPCPEEATATG